MTEKLTNYKLYEIDGETYSLEEIRGFIKASEKTAFLKRQNNALKMRCSDYSKKIGELKSENADLKFTINLLNSETGAKALYRELQGVPMTPLEIAEEEAISTGEAHYYNTAFIGDDF